jgi:mRNA-degrading endonuclease toxin of MazEF toxin-antitoxin module
MKNHEEQLPTAKVIREGKAMADQLATVSKARLSKRIGTLSPQDIRKVGNAIKIHLDLH